MGQVQEDKSNLKNDGSLKSVFFRSSCPEVFCEKGVLRNFAKFTGTLPKACNFIKKETLAQVFSCEFCEISKNTFLMEHLSWLLLFFNKYVFNKHCLEGLIFIVAAGCKKNNSVNIPLKGFVEFSIIIKFLNEHRLLTTQDAEAATRGVL